MARSRRVRRAGVRPKPAAGERVERTVEIVTSASRMQASSFVDFIRERGVVGLMVGIILGSSVTAAANSFVDDVVDPLLALLLGSQNRLDELTIHLSTAEIRIGQFITALIDVLLLVLFVFFVFKFLKLDKLDKKKIKVKETG